jgi:N6-adenosine-specific RNA methylase IME4
VVGHTRTGTRITQHTTQTLHTPHNPQPPPKKNTNARSQEHCLLGVRGNPRRGEEDHLVHCNIEVDVLVAPEPPLGSTAKPEELYELIERFWNGRCAVVGRERNRAGGFEGGG